MSCSPEPTLQIQRSPPTRLCTQKQDKDVKAMALPLTLDPTSFPTTPTLLRWRTSETMASGFTPDDVDRQISIMNISLSKGSKETYGAVPFAAPSQ